MTYLENEKKEEERNKRNKRKEIRIPD